MIGRLDTSSKDVTILGAGIAGLLAAYYLDQAGWAVTLIDGAAEVGGLLGTKQTNHGISETAAHSIPATKTVQKLFDELGVRLVPMNENSKARYIFKKGRLRKIPISIFQILTAFLRTYFKLAPKRDPESLTLGEWSRHFLGKPAYDFLAVPFTRGIFGCEPDEISVSAAFPMLCVPRGHSLLSFMLAKKWRKNPPRAVKRERIVISKGPISAPENGMGEWVSALSTHLSANLGERFQRTKRVQSLEEFSKTRNLILALPASEAARLIAAQQPELSEELSHVKYSPLISATVFARAEDFEKPINGLGVLIPASEKRRCLGILFNSSSFPNRVSGSNVSLTVMLGGSGDPEVLEKSEAELLKIIQMELQQVLGFKGEPLEVLIHRWPKAVPQYNDHLLKTWTLAQETWCSEPGRILFGNYTGQVSLRGMVELAAHHFIK